MRTVQVFRALIVAGFVIAVLGSVVDVVVPNLLPKALEDAYDAYIEEDPALTTVLIAGAGSLIVLVAAIVATVGLLLLKRWARGLALLTTVLTMVIYPLLGPMLYSGWASMLIESSMIMWGAVLAMAYYSELRTHFERPPAPAPGAGADRRL